MSTYHRKALAATFACAAITLTGLPASAASSDDRAMLPGDVRVWKLADPGGAAPVLLPGDLRARERALAADAGASGAPVETQVVTVDDDGIELLQLGVGALAGLAGASAVALFLSSRRTRTTAGPFGPAATR